MCTHFCNTVSCGQCFVNFPGLYGDISIMCLSTSIRASAGHNWASVTAFCQRLFRHHQHCTMSRTVSIILLGSRPPSLTGDQCPVLWDPSYARIISHCILRLLNMFPVGLTSLHWLHWYNMLAVPSRDVRCAIYVRYAVTSFFKIPSYKCQRGKTLKICYTYSHNIK